MAMSAEPVDSFWWHTAAAAERRALSIASPRPHQHLADVRQAGLFIELLQDELADLTSILTATEGSGRSARSNPGRRPSALDVRINEVTRLLDALTSRFPAA
jgi:hypothetical protein